MCGRPAHAYAPPAVGGSGGRLKRGVCATGHWRQRPPPPLLSYLPPASSPRCSLVRCRGASIDGERSQRPRCGREWPGLADKATSMVCGGWGGNQDVVPRRTRRPSRGAAAQQRWCCTRLNQRKLISTVQRFLLSSHRLFALRLLLSSLFCQGILILSICERVILTPTSSLRGWRCGLTPRSYLF